jgi:signal transduction histidine kinase
MAVSYVVVTAAAAVLVEVVVIVLAVPRLTDTANDELEAGDRVQRVEATAADLASRVSARAARLGRLPTPNELRIGGPLALRPGEAKTDPTGKGVLIPYTADVFGDSAPMSMALLLTLDGRIASGSYPARFPAGATFDAPSRDGLLWKASGVGAGPDGAVRWATAPVADYGGLSDTNGAPTVLGVVYVQVPATAGLPGPDANHRPPTVSLGERFVAAALVLAIVLAGAIPLGVLFGLLSTRRLVGRMRRLARSTVAVAGGDFRHRVPVSGADEVGQLEDSFNRMAERLVSAVDSERRLAGAVERARIARELHDSISQDLFSLRMLAGGLHKALPAESPLQHQVRTIEETATGTLHEMRALLLELRPAPLADASLVPAIEKVCRAYSTQFGVAVNADLESVEVSPDVEHALLRVAQESVANAVRHGRPTQVDVALSRDDGHVVVTVHDNGVGFDPTHRRRGLGLDMMRERVAELGGEFTVESSLDAGTVVRVRLPAGTA